METIVAEMPVTAPKPAKTVYPTIKESWGFLGWYLLASLVVGVPVYALCLLVFQLPKSVSGIIVTISSNMALLWFVHRRVMKRGQVLQLSGRVDPLLYVALPLLVVTMMMLLTLLDFLHLPDWTNGIFKELAQKPLFIFVTGVVIVPVLEELLFRGVLLQGLLRNYRPWVAIGQTSLLFGLVHLNPAQSLGAMFIGLVLGWLYYRTRSLWVCMAVHALNNLLAFGAMLLFPETQNTVELFEAPWIYAAVVTLSALVLAGLLWRVQQTTTVLPEETVATDTPQLAAMEYFGYAPDKLV